VDKQVGCKAQDHHPSQCHPLASLEKDSIHKWYEIEARLISITLSLYEQMQVAAVNQFHYR